MNILNSLILFMCIFKLSSAAQPNPNVTVQAAIAAQAQAPGKPALIQYTFDVSTRLGKELHDSFSKQELETKEAAEWCPTLDQFLQNGKQIKQALDTFEIDLKAQKENQEGLQEFGWYFKLQSIDAGACQANKEIRKAWLTKLRKDYPQAEKQFRMLLNNSKMIEKLLIHEQLYANFNTKAPKSVSSKFNDKISSIRSLYCFLIQI